MVQWMVSLEMFHCIFLVDGCQNWIFFPTQWKVSRSEFESGALSISAVFYQSGATQMLYNLIQCILMLISSDQEPGCVTDEKRLEIIWEAHRWSTAAYNEGLRFKFWSAYFLSAWKKIKLWPLRIKYIVSSWNLIHTYV